MAIAINRTTKKVHAPADIIDHPGAFIIDRPDPEAFADYVSLLDSGIPSYHWDLDDGPPKRITEMSQGDKDTVDATRVSASKTAKEASIKSEVTHDPLQGYAVDIQVSGLILTVNINSIVVDDITTVVADPSDTKFVMLCYVYNETTDSLSIQAFEKTTGLYADVGLDEYIVKDLGEWSVGAAGTVLVAT